MALPMVVQNILELATIFGKVVLSFEHGQPMPKGKVGDWILDHDPRNNTYLIREIADIAGNFRYPFGDFSIEANEFHTAVNMTILALKEYKRIRDRIPPQGEIDWAHLPRVTIDGTTYYRDDAKQEFGVVGQFGQCISFKDYEQKYFGGERAIRAHFSGNVVTMQGQSGSGVKSYETTNQENAIQVFEFWILNGVLKPGSAPEIEPKRPGRGTGNWFEIIKETDLIRIADNYNQKLETKDVQKAIRAVRSWVYGGILKG